VLALDPDHPLGIHLYIHATEAGPNPGAAAPFADRLGDITPGVGHLVHMPGHTYIRVGRYADAASSNVAALAADNAYFDTVGPQGMYELYRSHNYHFLAYAAMFQGDPETALRAARGLVRDLPPHVLDEQSIYAEGFLAVPWHVLIRFGEWEAILEEPKPETRLTLAEALWHYARGIAFVNLGEVSAAEEELAAFEESVEQVPEEAFVALSEAGKVLDIARLMLRGELRFRKGDQQAALADLSEAVALEDALPYNEPKGWMQPVRHALGALLMEAGHVEHAEQVYRADLVHNPENGWALHGLAESLELQGRDAEAAEASARFDLAWERAAIDIQASCYCREVDVVSDPEGAADA